MNVITMSDIKQLSYWNSKTGIFGVILSLLPLVICLCSIGTFEIYKWAYYIILLVAFFELHMLLERTNGHEYVIKELNKEIKELKQELNNLKNEKGNQHSTDN